ncbi:NAD(P)/FAD-dependent oxidoreductase [Ottowia testudinis]|uniref:FAD-dependent oxidoreductase n=1 Tax=Ottowia testudinis TaxID=2816950 RepID=A0A975CFZ0_9BURK|nr:NAD(P)/FAD-dependent oxidoreductase [Ottowia testudinis]QTD45695.1 FAD-dependent oxidoreductase [Ottowia testudinis]
MKHARVLIVGAGPAGVRAAQTLVAHGLRPVVVDEAARAGGQIYRHPPAALGRSGRQLYGFDADQARAVHQTFDALAERIDWLPATQVWNVRGQTFELLHGPSRRVMQIDASHAILATGATDRALPVPGWTLPGSFTLGGAQVALKSQASLIGSRVVFMGSGPLLYLVAWQYARAGGGVAAVLDTASPLTAWRAWPHLLAQPGQLARGLVYMAGLRRRGVPMHGGVTIQRIEGAERVSAVVWQDARGRQHATACDAVACGHGLRAETQLADLLDCEFHFDPLQRAHLPRTDAAGRTSVPRLYLAGDGAAIRGARAAEAAGELAALALLADGSVAVDATRMRALERLLDRLTRFRRGLEQAFPWPPAWAAQTPDELVVCRCENVTAGQLRATVALAGSAEINRVKALCRVGMGRCQGRMCAPAAAELLAYASGWPLSRIGRLRAQAPIKPLPLDVQPGPEEAAP